MNVNENTQQQCAVFVGVNLDGFIARPNGDLDWLMGEGGGDSAEYGYNEFVAGIDAIVMGRNTFEKVLTFDKWYYGNKRVVVLSHRSFDLSVAQARGGLVEQMAGTPARIVSDLNVSGARHLYVDGWHGPKRIPSSQELIGSNQRINETESPEGMVAHSHRLAVKAK